jgi:fructokinase
MDRLSRAILDLAKQASADGALVAFEPSSKSDPKHLKEALTIAHVVKYADERFAQIGGVMTANSSVLVEVQTLGAEGLRYRHRLTGRTISSWMHLEAVKPPKLADTCGAGDWCTAGLLSKIAFNGIAGLRQRGAIALREGLRYGQTLAAWNCGFEGARGGMYVVSHSAFSIAIKDLIAGRPVAAKGLPVRAASQTINCPACRAHPRRRKSQKRKRAA